LGKGAASSYRLTGAQLEPASASVADTRSEVAGPRSRTTAAPAPGSARIAARGSSSRRRTSTYERQASSSAAATARACWCGSFAGSTGPGSTWAGCGRSSCLR